MKLFAGVCVLSLALGGVALAGSDSSKDAAAATTQPAKPANTKCPVSGEDIDPAVTTQYEGKTIAFCCKDCIAGFKKDPQKYMKNLK